MLQPELVARDVLEDGGAWLYAETVRQIHSLTPDTGVELLIPDFNADPEQLAEVFVPPRGARAQRRDGAADLGGQVRPGFRYERSLEVITKAREAGLVTKSNLILGMGEERGDEPGAAGSLRRGL
ncbi:Lipoyl synthase OS=Streptomyces antimycoticus OX=68175 GN=lipA PE=3 SV=1 [Streptomyces antimycoticus]